MWYKTLALFALCTNLKSVWLENFYTLEPPFLAEQTLITNNLILILRLLKVLQAMGLSIWYEMVTLFLQLKLRPTITPLNDLDKKKYYYVKG